jgi:hypothetical protein
MNKNWWCALTAIVGLALGIAPEQARAEYLITVVMSGLDNPRGLAFGPDSNLYVAEAGRGGPGPGILGGAGQVVFYGASGAVSRLRGTVQERVLTGLPSLAPVGGVGATGLHDVGFSSSGEAFGLIGFGANPALRPQLGAVGAEFGRVVRLPLTGGPVQGIADLVAYEAAQNPDRGALDSNPYGLLVLPGGGFVATDAGGNDLLRVTAAGAISTLSVLPDRPNPLPFGPPVFQAVPTTVTLGPDGAYYAGELTGVPFPPGAANVYRIDPVTGELTVAFSGFTNIIDLTFGPDGSLYVLQISRDGLASPTGPVPGALFRVNPVTGERTLIASDGLNFPTGVVVGPDGWFYVSNFGTSPGGGQVVRLTAIPEPGTWVLLGSGLLGLGLAALRRRV